ncbi:unnamed protein product [Oikopleura dioica]|uniref:Uncharacterized protein n=1 Tax=Oikopleura dioica TaxID=34765 RepID=E4XPN7_OIKDI|nr:unnamed protein product [Oikopleura dioica]
MRFGLAKKLPFSATHCAQLVKKAEWENFICISSVSDIEKRRSLFALRAFNIAILTSIEKVSQPAFAQARITFLKTGLADIYAKDKVHAEHPILDELSFAVNSHKYPKAWLQRLISERLKDDRLTKQPFETLKDFEKYHEATTGSLWLLSLMSANVKDVNCDVAAKHAARCVALANILRAQAVMKTREIVIPLEFIAAHKVDMRRLVEKKNDEKIEEMIFDIATVAHANLTKIQSMRSKIPDQAHDIFRQLTGAETYLKNLQAKNFNLFDPSLSVRNDFLALQIFKKKMKREF